MDKISLGRRNALKKGAIAVVAIPLAMIGRSALAGKAAKSDFHYMDHPNEGKHCAGCAAFLPSAKGPDAPGECRIVAGPIDPNGWCMAFTAK